MSKRALVTGAAGFIGSNLSKRLIEEGWIVTGVDDLSNGFTEFVPDGMMLLHAECSDKSILRGIKNQNYDVVFHVAAIPRVSYSVEFPACTNMNNVQSTLELMEACRGNIQRFVFSSSSSVYGGALALPTPETSPKDPKSPYALQKSIIEDYLKMFHDLYGFESVCLRYFNVIGPHSLGTSAYATALASWLTCIKAGQPMRSDGTGEQSRDLCYVGNVVDANILAANSKNELSGSCINVGSGEAISNNEVLKILLQRYAGSHAFNAPVRAGDVMHTRADVSKAKALLGYSPKVSVAEGIERTIEWYESDPLATSLKARI